MKDTRIIRLPSPKSIVEHYASHVIDPNTIVVIAHFIEQSEGFNARCGFSTMTINLTTPLSVLDESYLSAPGNEEFKPADICDFYGDVDEETHRQIIRAQGDDPDEVFARWESTDQTEHEGYYGSWVALENRMPDPGQTVLIRTNQDDVIPATWNGEGWHCDDDRAIGCKFTHWTAFPSPPITF